MAAHGAGMAAGKAPAAVGWGSRRRLAAVVDACVRAIERRVLADWQRVRGDVTSGAAMSFLLGATVASGPPPSL